MTPTKKVVSEYECRVTHDNAVRELRKCLKKISKPSRRSRIEWFELSVIDVEMTPTILALLVQVLNQPLPKTRFGTELKWEVRFQNCIFRELDSTDPMTDDEASCSQEDIQMFASSLARRTFGLTLDDSPEILECLFNTPQLEMNAFSISYSWIYSMDCARLGNFVQSCVSLKNVEIDVSESLLEDPLSLVEGLANAFHLQSISFTSSSYAERVPALSDVLVRDGGNGIIGQLVSPQSRLRKLALVGVNLEDRHFLQIVHVLPTSQLQVLNVSDNNIGRQGILSFARQLPRIKSLNVVDLAENPWTNDHDLYEECIAALLQGIMENHSIEELWVSYQEKRLEHCILAKMARRIILETVDPIPLGLVPWILERIGTQDWSFEELYPAQDEEVKFQAYRANALYFVLQNSPILCSTSLRKSRRKRKQVDRYH